MSGKVYSVSNSTELYNALAVADGGDTIELASGDYGDLTLDNKSGFDITYDAPVTIVSADPNNPATITSMWLNGAENLTFDSIMFDFQYSDTDEVWSAPFRVHNGDHITIQNSTFDGVIPDGRNEIDDGYGFGKGLEVSGTDNVAVVNNEFYDWHRGMVMDTGTNLTIQGNEIYSIRSDGMDFAQVHNVVIEDNYIHDFESSPLSGDHEDMIQVWTTNTTVPSSDIYIRNNVLDVGEGSTTQSIFMRNGVVDLGQAGEEMYYQNIVIEENVILNGHSHGITVGETNGLTIQNNTVLSIDPTGEEFHSVPAINLSPSHDVTVTNNVVGHISGVEPGYNVNDNVYVQNSDPDLQDYYDTVFVESSFHEPGGVGSYVFAPGGEIEELNAGAARSHLDTNPSSLTPQFDVQSSEAAGQSLVFDAAYTFGPGGEVEQSDAIFRWDFGDGQTAGGRVVEHTYDTPGYYEVTLEVTQDGVVETARAQVGVAGDDLLSYDAAQGQFTSHGYGVDAQLAGAEGFMSQTTFGQSVELGGGSSVLEIPKEEITRFYGNDGFEMSMLIQADQPGNSSGEIVRIHDSFILSVEPDGDVKLQVFPEGGGKITVTSNGASVNDGGAHEIGVRFDGETDSLEILVDGQVAGSGEMEGSMKGIGFHGLTFGDPWGSQGFDGKMHSLELSANTPDYEIFDGELEFQEIREDEDKTELPEIDDFVVDFAALDDDNLVGGATVVTEGDKSFVELDQINEYVGLDRQREFESSDQIAASVEFQKESAGDGDMRVIWNYNEIGVVVEEDGLTIHYGQDDTKFRKSSVTIDDLDLDDTDTHQVVVLADAGSDRLQVLLDGEVVLDQNQDLEIEFGGGGDRKDKWTLGSKKKQDYTGEIHDFRVEDTADFVDSDTVPDDASLFG